MLTVENISHGSSLTRFWKLINKEHHKAPFHDPYIIDGLVNSLDNKFVACVKKENNKWLFSVFQITNSIALCIFSGYPLMSSGNILSPIDVESFFIQIYNELKLPIYLPLVFLDTYQGEALKKTRLASWSRLPNPIVTFNDNITDRIVKRAGKRAIKNWKKFENSDAEIATFTRIESIRRYIKLVETASWKSKVCQDMLSKNQYEIYCNLAKSPRALLRVVIVNELPVAYRLDIKIGDIVFALKWSYCENNKRIAPGFYLLTKDIERCWSGKSIKFVDLFGSPDTMKEVICDKTMRKRYDYAWPSAHCAIKALQIERQVHDNKLNENFSTGKGLRHAYEK